MCTIDLIECCNAENGWSCDDCLTLGGDGEAFGTSEEITGTATEAD